VPPNSFAELLALYRSRYPEADGGMGKKRYKGEARRADIVAHDNPEYAYLLWWRRMVAGIRKLGGSSKGLTARSRASVGMSAPSSSSRLEFARSRRRSNNRRLQSTPSAAATLQRYAVTWGVEWDVRLAGGNWWDHVLNAPTLPTFSRDSANLIAAEITADWPWEQW